MSVQGIHQVLMPLFLLFRVAAFSRVLVGNVLLGRFQTGFVGLDFLKVATTCTFLNVQLSP